MKTKKLIYGITFICFLAFSIGPIFFVDVKTAFCAQKAAKTAKAAHKKSVKKAMPSEKIRAVQTALNNAGFTLQEDGFMGKKTKQALKKFQKENGLKVTGKADKETLAKLGI